MLINHNYEDNRMRYMNIINIGVVFVIFLVLTSYVD